MKIIKISLNFRSVLIRAAVTSVTRGLLDFKPGPEERNQALF